MAQFSVRQLLMVVVLAAIVCTAVVRADRFWAGGVFLVTVVTLLISVVGALVCRGRMQAFWIGVTVLGWGYLWVAHWPSQPYGSTQRHWKLEMTAQGNLITTQLLLLVLPADSGGAGLSQQNHFAVIGHSVFALAFAYLGGVLGRHFYSQRRDE